MELPYILTKNVASIIENLDSLGFDSKPIRMQIEPSEQEKFIQKCELTDPLGANEHSITSHLIHQYKNRVLFLTTSNCFGYCRYCFRRNFTCLKESRITESELEQICKYLAEHEEVQEILFSGGDPLMLQNNELSALISRIRESRPEILIRICTRAIFFAPERFTDETVSMLRSFKPLWVIPHINHPYEIDKKIAPKSFDAINRILDAGVSMQSQTVLLRGINDNTEILASLFENLTKLGIKPGYLFQTDLAQGTSHFRVPVDNAVALYENLRRELSGLSLPTFAVDLPGGGGKFNLLQLESGCEGTKVIRHDENYEFVRGGKSYFYPRA